jgi:hypothetical protein
MADYKNKKALLPFGSRAEKNCLDLFPRALLAVRPQALMNEVESYALLVDGSRRHFIRMGVTGAHPGGMS